MKALRKSQIVFNPLPAVVIGGPPHSGKSVLAYSLTQVLRERAVPHYLLRAYPPDCEGDWFHRGEPATVRLFRMKGARSEAWLPLLRRDIARRHLPLIVDMGGMPTQEQETVLNECTHALLLTPGNEARQEWADRLSRYGLVLLADLHSCLQGENSLEQDSPLLVGTLAGLERGKVASGPAFLALVARLETLFGAVSSDLYHRHLRDAPAELVVDLERLSRQMGWDPAHLRPQNLPEALDYLPARVPLALYGRGPNWLYAAVAAHVLPAPFFLFDARLGWVETPFIPTAEVPPDSPITLRRHPLPGAQLLAFSLRDSYLDITEAHTLRFPSCEEQGVVLSGKLPLWLWAALVRACSAEWIAVVQPQLQGAMVVRTRGGEPGIGTVLDDPRLLKGLQRYRRGTG